MSHGGSGAIISLFIFFCNSALTGSIFLETLSKKSIMRNAMSPMLIQPLKVCCDCLLCELTFLASFEPGSQCKYNRAWERRIKLSDWIGPKQSPSREVSPQVQFQPHVGLTLHIITTKATTILISLIMIKKRSGLVSSRQKSKFQCWNQIETDKSRLCISNNIALYQNAVEILSTSQLWEILPRCLYHNIDKML